MAPDAVELTYDAERAPLSDVASALGVEPPTRKVVERTWYDTFDWKLWRNGRVIEADESAGAPRTVLRDARTHRVLWTQCARTVPRLATELPAGPWRRDLVDVIGIRALVPVARARVATIEMRVSDARGKAVASVLWEEITPLAGREPMASRAVRLVRVVPMHGYEASATETSRRLRRDAGLTPSREHPLSAAAPPGRTPGNYSSKLSLPLHPVTPAGDATRRILTELFGIMQANEPWLFEAPDTEFLHDFRVALRRSRSVLKQANRVVSADLLARWRPILRDLQRHTNAHRDLDVFLIEFESYRALVPQSFAADLEPLRDLVLEQLHTEHARLATYLRSPAYERTTQEYAEFLDGALSDENDTDATRPVAGVARDRIERARRRLVRRGRAVTRGSPNSDVHQVRILGKELRYLLEVYGGLFPAEPLARAVRELKLLQDTLGEFQDSEVHLHETLRFADELHAGRAGSSRSSRPVMAIGLLSEAFARRQQAARERFAARFAAFASKQNTRRFERLLAHDASAGRE